MLYRIRYQDQTAAGEGEIAVEANSPNEAVVKFRHIREDLSDCAKARRQVTSVFPDEEFGEDVQR